MKRVASVSYDEEIAIKVGQFLTLQGFVPALESGMAVDYLTKSDSIGVLYKDPEVENQWKFPFSLIKKNPRREFLGIIWFNDEDRGASEKRWVFEMYGRKYSQLMRQLAERASLAFNVKIDARLVDERSKKEEISSDTYPMSP